MQKTIVLASNGTLGDVLPVLAVAEQIAAKGAHPVIVSNADHLSTIKTAGFDAHAVFPTLSELGARGGDDAAGFMRKFGENPATLFDRSLDDAAETARAFVPIAHNADFVIANHLALGAHLGSELAQTPSAFMIYQPIGLSAWYLLDVARMSGVRQSLGLPVKGPADQHDYSPWLKAILGLYSPVMGKNLPDLPWPMELTGFPIGQGAAGTALSDETQAFVDAGSPPLVFTLGSYLPQTMDRIYGTVAELSEAMEMRAVVLGAQSGLASAGTVHVAGFEPHPALFDQAAAIVHHGGIGTTAAALRAGKPQLIVPHVSDAGDNAERVARLGVSETLHSPQFSLRPAQRRLERLMNDPEIAGRARRIARRLAQENGAELAARRILEIAS